MSSADLITPFCSYCGRPPNGTGHHAGRICPRCHFGMMLRAPAGRAPRARDPFLIVDEQLTVQAISGRAEHVLRIDEPDGVRAPLDYFLEPADGTLSHEALARALMLAVEGSPPPSTFGLQSVDEPDRRFAARVTTCGHPLAALLVLTPMRERAVQSANGRSRPEAAAETRATAPA